MGTSTREITFNRSLFKVQSACQRTSHRSSAQARPGEYSRRRPLLLRSARLACGSAVAPGVQCSASGRWAPLLRLTRRSRPDMRCPRVWCHAMASGSWRLGTRQEVILAGILACSASSARCCAARDALVTLLGTRAARACYVRYAAGGQLLEHLHVLYRVLYVKPAHVLERFRCPKWG